MFSGLSYKSSCLSFLFFFSSSLSFFAFLFPFLFSFSLLLSLLFAIFAHYITLFFLHLGNGVG